MVSKSVFKFVTRYPRNFKDKGFFAGIGYDYGLARIAIRLAWTISNKYVTLD